MKERNVDVVIGPPCPMTAEIMAYLSTYYKKIMLGWGFLIGSLFADLHKFPYVTKVIPDSLMMMKSVLQLFELYKWDRVAVYYTTNEVRYCDSIIEDALATFADGTSYFVEVVQKVLWNRVDSTTFREQMKRTKTVARSLWQVR
ncbi:unnamed protein product [Cylicostephanus goldi]|uniref:Receptor ligand binding region domain-containing protein n=1 Tax=Cylicostephanus goldi TaxID=71465 RepID=A0A3P6QTB1_CYLGO|nr:unnamed protein product [Cylicostephanus goldi]